MAKRDYYEILGVKRNASQDEIKKAHRKLVRQHHPDVNSNSPQSAEKFKEVQEAYDTLSDDAKRAQYDQFGHAGPRQGPPPGADPFEQFRRQQGGRRPQTWQGGGPGGATVEDFDFDMGGAGGMGSIFEQLFGQSRGAGGGRGRGGRARAEAPRGSDIEHPVALTFEQAARGSMLPLQVNRDGKLETIEIKIPAGVKDGSRVRIKGQGQHTGNGGAPGDLFIITTVEPHPYFRREGLDVLIDFPISLYEAIKGAKITAPTLDGPVTLTIPPGTSSHAKLRIKGRGIHRGTTEKGDQLVVVKIMIPKDLDDEDRKLFEDLAAKHPLNPRADVKW